MSKVVYVSNVRIERRGGPNRLAYLPGETEPVSFGVHGAIAEHYKVDPDAHPPHATTLDYIIAAAAGWLTGTFGGALEARQLGVQSVTGVARGEVELEDHVLVIRRIHVIYEVTAPEEARTAIERVHGFHHDKCPVYRSISSAIAITTEFKLSSS